MEDGGLTKLRKQLRAIMPSLRDEFGVGHMWIVGSRARGDYTAQSDLDLMVEFDRSGISLLGFCRLENQLSTALGIKVDLVEKGALDPRVDRTTSLDAILV